MIRRVNIWGGPGSGKSTTTAWLFANLKIAGHDIQFVEEHVKRWAYQKRPIISFDQMYLTACQVTAEDELLRSGVKHIITDCPCMLSYFFAKRNGIEYAPLIVELARHVERVYPSLNIYLYRDVSYQTLGRYETEEEAKRLDSDMLGFLQKEYKDLIVISPRNKEKLFIHLDDTLRRSLNDGPE
jgi:thymidylate kinase